jgi:hypothetical protein
MNEFFSNSKGSVLPTYDPKIVSRPKKATQLAPEQPKHIKEKNDLDNFGIKYGTGAQPNDWSKNTQSKDGAYSYEERAQWYDDRHQSHHNDLPHAGSDYWDYFDERERRHHSRHGEDARIYWMNLVAEEEQSNEDKIL